MSKELKQQLLEILERTSKFKQDEEVGYLLGDYDIIMALVLKSDNVLSFEEAEEFYLVNK